MCNEVRILFLTLANYSRVPRKKKKKSEIKGKIFKTFISMYKFVKYKSKICYWEGSSIDCWVYIASQRGLIYTWTYNIMSRARWITNHLTIPSSGLCLRILKQKIAEECKPFYALGKLFLMLLCLPWLLSTLV